MTGRNMQEAVKKKGLPWSAAKGFDTFTPIGCVHSARQCDRLCLWTLCRSFIPRSSIPDPHNLKIWLKVTNLQRSYIIHNLINHIKD